MRTQPAGPSSNGSAVEQGQQNDIGNSTSPANRYAGRFWCRDRAADWHQRYSRSPKSFKRTTTLGITARHYLWRCERRRGLQAKTIAGGEGFTVRRIQVGVARARTSVGGDPPRGEPRPPLLIPFFPVGPFTPHSECGHSLPMKDGSLLCCMVCHCSGMDGHPALRPDLSSESVRETAPWVHYILRETRRQRRRRI